MNKTWDKLNQKTPLKMFTLLTVVCLSLAYTPQSLAGMRCSLVHQVQIPAVEKLVEYNAFAQWLKWEQTANIAKFRKSTEPIMLPIAKIARNELDLQIDPSLPKKITKNFISGQSVLWIKHLYNTAKTVPFLTKANVASMPAYFTASRSMALTGELQGFTLKVPTNRPHGPQGELQTPKADTSADVFTALLHSGHIKERDEVLGKDNSLIILPEVLTVADKESKIGYVLRDVRETDDGHYYLPALSIPYVGREIARINKSTFENFWKIHYARALGIAKAKLLLRYGLQMETPNAQNMLIQLDRNLRPTGRIVFRDVSDSFFVESVARGMGFTDAIKRDVAVDYTPNEYLNPFPSNSFWRMDEAGDFSVSTEGLKQWTQVHNFYYKMYILKELKIVAPRSLLIHTDLGDKMPELYDLLASPAGQAALKKYREQDNNKKTAKAS